MHHELLYMDTVPRRLRFPFPLSLFSYSIALNTGTAWSLIGKDLEFCIRLSSDEDYAEDVFDKKTYKTPFPYVLIKPPGVEHVNNIRGTREGLSLYYSSELLPEFNKAGIPTSAPGWSFQITPRITALIQHLRKLIEMSQVPGIAEQIDLSSFQLLEELLLQEYVENPTDSYAPKIRLVASYLQLHYNDDINLDDVLRKNGISRRTFFRHWKDFYQQSPMEYIRDLKFQEAARLLRESELSVEEILERLNFSDRTLFFRSFKQRFAISPAKYRKNETEYRFQ